VGSAKKQDNLNLKDYPFTIRQLSAEDGSGYLVEFPDVPGCMSDGETAEESMVNGLDALKSALLTLREFGEPFPQPSKIAETKLHHYGAWRRNKS
jgi:antitoxin HicB